MQFNSVSGDGASTSSRSQVIIRLPRKEGFAFDLAPSREDPLARRAAEHVFGKSYVDGCFQRLHRSTLSYDALVSDIMGYERVHPRRRHSDPVYAMALESVRRDFSSTAKLIPHTMGAVPHLADFPRQKSAGLPYKNWPGYRSKGDVVDDPDELWKINTLWHHISARKAHKPLEDVCLFARSQVCPVEKQKIRGVWGYPIEVYLEEARFFYPLMDWLKSAECKFPLSYGLEMANGGMVAIADLAQRLGTDSKYLMIDWSKFDKSIPPWLIRDAFDIIADVIDFDHVRDSEGKVWPVRAYRSRRRWKKLIDYFIETPVRTCKGERFLVRGGVPSGSCFTNVIDSIINCVVSRYISYQTTGAFPLGELYLGDDGVCFFPRSSYLDLDNLAKVAFDCFGLVLNRDKSYVTSVVENIHFIGYHNAPHCAPNRDQDLLVVSFIHPERSRRTAEECAAAALGQLWANFDPRIAALWYRVVIFVSDAFCVTHDDIVTQLRRTAHRHKYLSHLGRHFPSLTIPSPNEWGHLLEVLPAPVPKRLLPIRRYEYGLLCAEGWKRLHTPVEVDVDSPE